MSEASEELARRIRSQIGLLPDIAEKRMMGGYAFMLRGNMLVGPLKNGDLLVRVGKAGYADALQRPGAGPMTFTGREMSGFVQVSADCIEADEDLLDWIDLAQAFVLTLPPK